MKHFLSESALWHSKSEFVDSHGNITKASGESKIIVSENEIINESWAEIDSHRRVNNYRIIPISDTEYQSESINPELGVQVGQFNIDRNIIYSKFYITGTELNGFEVIIRENNECKTFGSLYQDNQLINTWKAILVKH